MVTRALQTEKESRKQASNEATPSAPPPCARGGSRLPPEGFPGAWEPAKAPTRATPWRRGSPKDRSCEPSPRTSRSCCSLRLRSGSTSFLRRESARVVCCWGVRGRRFEITWPSGHRPRERERGWVRREPAAEGRGLTSPTPTRSGSAKAAPSASLVLPSSRPLALAPAQLSILGGILEGSE